MEELFPEEIAGTARDSEIADKARQSKSSGGGRTQPGKRTGAGVVEERPVQKRVNRRPPSPDDESDDDDQEDSLRCRRRKR